MQSVSFIDVRWLRTTRHWVQKTGSGLLNLIYPPRCLSCSGPVQTPALPLCSTCQRGLERASSDDITAHLQRLDAPVDALDAATALWRFDKGGTLQPIQHALKYGNRPRYGVALGRLMAAAARVLGPSPDALIPIPLHRTRQLERGYNQSAMLAQGLGDVLAVPVWTGRLTRPQATPSQTNLPRSARWANVADAFHVPAPASVAGRRLLLVDDVLTTGSTAVAAAATLHAAGAAWIGLVTLGFARG